MKNKKVYQLKRIGNESENRKVLIRLKKRIINDLYNVRRNNECKIEKVDLTVYPAKVIDENNNVHLLKNYNEYYEKRELSLNFIKRNISSLL